MATPATHTPSYSIPILKDSYNEKIDYNNGTTWAIPVNNRAIPFNFFSEKYFSDNTIELQNNSKFFVKKLQAVIKEYEALSEYFPNVSKQELLKKLQPTLSTFMQIKVDTFCIELTKEESIFFTLKKNDLIFYIEQYLDEENDSEQFVITAFKNNQAALNKSGNISDIVTIMNSLSVNN